MGMGPHPSASPTLCPLESPRSAALSQSCGSRGAEPRPLAARWLLNERGNGTGCWTPMRNIYGATEPLRLGEECRQRSQVSPVPLIALPC